MQLSRVYSVSSWSKELFQLGGLHACVCGRRMDMCQRLTKVYVRSMSVYARQVEAIVLTHTRVRHAIDTIEVQVCWALLGIAHAHPVMGHASMGRPLCVNRRHNSHQS